MAGSVESDQLLIVNSMTCELNMNSLRILTVVFGDPNRLTAIPNNYLAEPLAVQRRPLSRFPTLEKGNTKLRLVFVWVWQLPNQK